MALERITPREWRAIGQALGFALAEGDPDLGHDLAAMESAHRKVDPRGWPAPLPDPPGAIFDGPPPRALDVDPSQIAPPPVPAAGPLEADSPSDQALAYIRHHYSVPAWPGHTVTVNGRDGVIKGGQEAHLLVAFAGETVPCHPTWRVEYVDVPAGQEPSDG